MNYQQSLLIFPFVYPASKRVVFFVLFCFVFFLFLISCVHAYMQTRHGEPAGLIRQRSNRDDERAVGDVLIVELD